MRNAIGDPVSGENFTNREKELKGAIHLLENQNSFLLLGIRRTGKSSFLLELAKQLDERDDNIVVQLNCQGYQSPLQFYKELHEALPKDLKTRLGKLLTDSRQLPSKLIESLTGGIKVLEAGGVKLEFKSEWDVYTSPLDNLLGSFFKENSNVILFLDELPFFFQNLSYSKEQVREIQKILTSLRTWRDAGLAMGIAGSLNLHLQLDNLGISRKLIAGLNTLKLEPFTREEAKSLLEKLLENKNLNWWTNEITEKVLDLLPDYVPYFLQLTFHHIVVNEASTPEEVEQVFHNDIQPNFQADFTYQFDERLAKFSNDELPAAQAILDYVVKNEVAAFSEMQKELGEKFQYDALTKLIDFEFLTLRERERYAFSLNILRNWWRQKRNL
ncbi:MAG: hypothetical protein R2825_09935 [Saprospiraceae bacterium]